MPVSYVRLAVVFAALVLTSCQNPASAPTAQPLTQQQPIPAQGAYVHQPSGMVFPAAIGDFQRAAVLRYDAGGADVSAGYNFRSPASTIVATVYVYPAPPLVSVGTPPNLVQSTRATLCAAEFERRKREIAAAHPDARLMGEGEALRPQPGPAVIGKAADYEFAAPNGLPLRSALYVYCYVGDKWAFEYRFTTQKLPDASDHIAAFMKALTWTIREK